MGYYFFDFLIEDRSVLEIKRGPKFKKEHFYQVQAYLQAKNLKLGIVVLFTDEQIEFKRILNMY